MDRQVQIEAEDERGSGGWDKEESETRKTKDMTNAVKKEREKTLKNKHDEKHNTKDARRCSKM